MVAFQISKQIKRIIIISSGYVLNPTNVDICYEPLFLMKTWIHISQPEATWNVNNPSQVGCFSFFPLCTSYKAYSYWIPIVVAIRKKAQRINLILNIYNISGTEACQMKLPGVVMVSGRKTKVPL